MQASKIIPNEWYAIRRNKDQLVRFMVKSVTTVRSRGTGSPHDYRSTVQGYVLEDRNPETQLDNIISIDSDKILGPYQDYVELVERKQREDAASKARANAEKEKTLDFVRLLYRVAGQPVPNTLDERGQPFRAGYSNSVEITEEGQELLRAVLSVKSHAA
jgi:hypothetical protein